MKLRRTKSVLFLGHPLYSLLLPQVSTAAQCTVHVFWHTGAI